MFTVETTLEEVVDLAHERAKTLGTPRSLSRRTRGRPNLKQSACQRVFSMAMWTSSLWNPDWQRVQMSLGGKTWEDRDELPEKTGGATE